MNSSEEYPLSFFEYVVNESNMVEVLNNQLQYYGFITYSFDLPNKCIHYMEQNDNGEYVNGEISMESLLLPVVRRKFNQSKELMYSIFLKSRRDTNRNFLLYQFNTVQSIVSKNKEFIKNFPLFLLPLRGIVDYINQRLKEPSEEEFLLDESEIRVNISGDLNVTDKSEDEIIHEIFDFMKGRNEKKEEILSNNDFNTLIELISHLVQKEEVPEVDHQISPKISNDQLRFSFWVLHDKLYTSKRIRPYFYDFVKEVFSNFNKSEVSSIKKQFGTTTRVVKDSFLPQIISNYL
ncbi:hypothetical protein GUA46_13960 [Muricauda sp. HICW]|uniref:Uncharacterized protein n=1 Tax=Flagellimonas chongwuensis TaxID=2697365 RepID=A0A850NE79_9FLAO|nr:hypothetical protein [Allomuricauda chongwuensis]NVN19451.1 hypothetical protein [Allomuricauda chongwuensis]